MRLIALALALAACAHTDRDPDLIDVRRADLVVTVDVEGELAAIDSTDIRPPSLQQLSRFSVAWMAPDGSDVAAGDRIVELDAKPLRDRLDDLQNEVASERQRLEQREKQATLTRNEAELGQLQLDVAAKRAALTAAVPGDLISAIDLRGRQLDAELTELALAQAKRVDDAARATAAADIVDLTDSRDSSLRQIDEIQREMTQMTLTAPRAGTVEYATPSAGTKRAVGDGLYESDVVLSIVGLDAMVGNGKVDEIAIGRLAVNQPVVLHVDAFPDLALHGAVQSIVGNVQPRSSSDPSALVDVQLTLSPVRGVQLRPGMQFRGEIETARSRDVVQVASDAVFVGPDGPFVLRANGSTLERVAVELGRRAGEVVEIRSGLVPGDRVSRVDPTEETP